MSRLQDERFYALLPAWYRMRDAERGQPLRALCAVIEEVFSTLEADLDTTWDNWFIETCEDWLVPYLGELVGVSGLRTVESAGFSLRAWVADAVALRQRKGTAVAVERTGWDTSGYPTRVVEYPFRLVAHAHIRHVRATPTGTVDLRSTLALQRIGTSLESQARTAEMRTITSGRGLFNLPNLGLHVFRTQVTRLTWTTARADATVPGLYRFHPAGLDVPLHHTPADDDSSFVRTGVEDTPHPLRRRELYAELTDPTVEPLWFAGTPALAVAVRMRTAGVWGAPEAYTAWNPRDGARPARIIRICALDTLGPRPVGPGEVGVDPELGRLIFDPADLEAPSGDPADVEVLVSWSHGRTGPEGADSGDRTAELAAAMEGLSADLILQVGRGAEHEQLEDALAAWDASTATTAVVCIGDSCTYPAPTGPLRVPAGRTLIVVAATTSDGVLTPDELRPHVIGDLVLRGEGTVLLDGLSIEGAVRVADTGLTRLYLGSCTLQGDGVRIAGSAGENAGLGVEIVASVVDGVKADGAIASVAIRDSLINGALSAPEASVAIERCTVLGRTSAKILEASECVFAESVNAAQHQEGCARFSFVPAGSRTPRRYRCQPDEALQRGEARDLVLARVRPLFASTTPGHPAFGRLAASGCAEIATCGENGREPGVHAALDHPLRLANLTAALRDAIRVGMQAGILLHDEGP